MEQYINKDALVAGIEKQIELGKFKCQQSQENNDRESYVAWSEHIATCGKILSFINTLETKKIVEHSPYDLDPIFEEIGIKPDSRMADNFKDAFYKAVDNLLNERITEK